jgi:NTP pyrophosphatase (non-canonical NTP hydrolase)
MSNLDIMTEAFVILQEECAEVTQAVCKAFRFGLDSRYKDGPTKKEELESEIGDLLCIIDILIQKAVLSDSNINAAKKKKREKLKKWSNLEL